MTNLTPVDTARIICATTGTPTFSPSGQPSDWRPITICAVMWQESRGDPHAIGKPVTVTVNARPVWAVALGWCQLLTAYHVDRGPYPDVPRMTVDQCFDIDASWERAWLVMNRGRTGWNYNLTPWSAYTTGAYKAHVPAALDAVRQVLV